MMLKYDTDPTQKIYLQFYNQIWYFVILVYATLVYKNKSELVEWVFANWSD